METIVLYPSPGMGHLISMVELGKLILRHRPSAAITVLTAPPSFNTGSTAAYIRRISAVVPSITFHHLPAISLDLNTFPSMEAIILETLRLSNPHVRRALETISATAGTISAFIIDFFCTSSLPIAAELNIPTYYFLTSGAAVLAFFLHFPSIHNTTTESFKDMKNTLLDVPGLPLFPSSDIMVPLLDRETTDYKNFLEFSLKIPNSAGLIVNTFESLETRSLQTIREGKCNPNGRTPPVFTVGPLLATDDPDSRGGAAHDCLKWLDKQPSKSVVYLCFGSLGLFSKTQLGEIALGLEKSGHRFLWVVRSPPSDDENKRFLPPPEPDLNCLLPTGFLERTRGRGLVVKSWAPQVAVLGHGSVGGFVTHCGWNSVLEAVCAAVPMLAWPLYAEQKFNRTVLVEEMKVSLRMETAEDDGFVAAEEVERRVRELMETERGEEIRKVVEEKSSEAKAAMAGRGSSIVALWKLIESWKKGRISTIEVSKSFLNRLKSLASIVPDAERKARFLAQEDNLFKAGLRLTDPATELAQHLQVFYPFETPEDMSSLQARIAARAFRIGGKKKEVGESSKRKEHPTSEEPAAKKPAEDVVLVPDSPPKGSARLEGPQQSVQSSAPPHSPRRSVLPSSSTLLEHLLGVNSSRAEACAAWEGLRPSWWLEYVKAATPNAEAAALLPDFVREAAEVPLRAWTSEGESSYSHMGTVERFQCSAALIGQALDFLLGATGAAMDMDGRLQRVTRSYNELKTIHSDCEAWMESLRSEVERLNTRAEEFFRQAEDAQKRAEAEIKESRVVVEHLQKELDEARKADEVGRLKKELDEAKKAAEPLGRQVACRGAKKPALILALRLMG